MSRYQTEEKCTLRFSSTIGNVKNCSTTSLQLHSTQPASEMMVSQGALMARDLDSFLKAFSAWGQDSLPSIIKQHQYQNQ